MRNTEAINSVSEALSFLFQIHMMANVQLSLYQRMIIAPPFFI
jgi:hypothetical protein